jgi:exodeoxyribonuclease VII large subunit
VTHSYSVAELSTLVAATLDEAFADDVWVTGEIRDINRSAAGHVYFQLVEPSSDPGVRPSAALAVVLFDQNRRAVNAMLRRARSVKMTDGVQVRIRATLDFYPPQGRLQLRMVGIDPFHTLGALEAEREQTLRALAAEGLLGRNAGVHFPSTPITIGVVTSAGSAAHADFVEEFTASGMAWRLLVADARVQGREAEASIVDAIDALVGRGVDVIALVRGGGARTDLAAFDSERIARAIAACPTPVVTGIGHEVDTSVADSVAARSYKTPTACAAALVAAGRDSLARADDLWAAIVVTLGDHLAEHTDRLRRCAAAVAAGTRRDLELGEQGAAVAGHRLQREATHALERSATDLDHVRTGIGGAGRHVAHRHDLELRRRSDVVSTRANAAVDHADRILSGHEAHAGVLDPGRALARGWSITRTVDGRIVRATDDLDRGAELVTTIADGRIESVVTEVDPDPPNDPGDPDG